MSKEEKLLSITLAIIRANPELKPLEISMRAREIVNLMDDQTYNNALKLEQEWLDETMDMP